MEKLDSKDLMAVHILNGLLNDLKNNSTITHPFVAFIISCQNHDEEKIIFWRKEVKKICRVCYELADIMKEVKLEVFE